MSSPSPSSSQRHFHQWHLSVLVLKLGSKKIMTLIILFLNPFFQVGHYMVIDTENVYFRYIYIYIHTCTRHLFCLNEFVLCQLFSLNYAFPHIYSSQSNKYVLVIQTLLCLATSIHFGGIFLTETGLSVVETMYQVPNLR